MMLKIGNQLQVANAKIILCSFQLLKNAFVKKNKKKKYNNFYNINILYLYIMVNFLIFLSINFKACEFQCKTCIDLPSQCDQCRGLFR
jgi:hypothetical protein